MFWFNRQHPDVVYGDCRRETITVTDRSHGVADGQRTLRIEPDVLLDFRALPYPDGTFRLVVFDPPHLVRAGPRSWLAAKYGKLSDNWRDDLRAGFAECFRVLAADGVLVFKWNETQVKVRDVLALVPVQPLFGHPTGRQGLTHWLVFIKPEERGGAMMFEGIHIQALTRTNPEGFVLLEINVLPLPNDPALLAELYAAARDALVAVLEQHEIVEGAPIDLTTNGVKH